MGAVVYLPEADHAGGPLDVLVGGAVIYTLEPGIPQHIPNEHLAAVKAAAAGAEGTLTVPTPTISHPSAATRRFAIVTVIDGPADSAPGTGVNVTSFADVTLNWTADLTETGGYKVLESADAGVTWHVVGTVSTGITTFHYTGQVGSPYTPAGGTASTSVITPTPNYGSARLYKLVAVGASGDSVPSSTVTDSSPPTTVNSTDLVRVSWTDPDADPEVSYKVLRGGLLLGTAAAQATHFDDTGQSTSSYTAAVSNPALGRVIDSPLVL
jgi:hypothetical protein